MTKENRYFGRKYFDIHAHILPGVDDGASEMNQTIRMLKLAASEGITTIIATPHYVCGKNNPDTDHLEKLRCQVQEAAACINKDFKILLGNEIYYSESVIEDLKRKKALTLAGSRYVLVEFSVYDKYTAIYHGIGKLINQGYMPVLAHMERYICLQRKPDLISELVEAGCYISVNSASLIGGALNMEAVYIRKLINMGLVHFIGSDCHDDRTRIPVMKTAVKHLIKRCSAEIIESIMYVNPSKILENTYI